MEFSSGKRACFSDVHARSVNNWVRSNRVREPLARGPSPRIPEVWHGVIGFTHRRRVMGPSYDLAAAGRDDLEVLRASRFMLTYQLTQNQFPDYDGGCAYSAL